MHAVVLSLSMLLAAELGDGGGASPADKAKTDRIRIDEKLNAQVPLDARFTTSDGREVAFGELLRKDKPTLLSVGYYSCPMLCDVVLNGVKGGVKALTDLVPGKDYQIVSISIEPKDTPELAREKKKNYLETLGRPIDPSGWEFLTTSDQAQAKRVSDAVGWNFFWDEDTKQWAHAAGVFLLTPEGKVSRVLYGISYAAADLKLGLIEASQGKVGTAVDRLLLWCFHYDPQGRTYVIYAVRVMRIGGALTVLAIALMVGTLVRSSRRRQAGASHESV